MKWLALGILAGAAAANALMLCLSVDSQRTVTVKANHPLLQQLNSGALQNRSQPVDRLAASPHGAVFALHSFYRPERNFRFLRQLLLRPTERSTGEANVHALKMNHG